MVESAKGMLKGIYSSSTDKDPFDIIEKQGGIDEVEFKTDSG